MNMIPLFPYWTFSIHSPLSQPEALARLSSAVAPIPQIFGFSWATRPQVFSGTILGNEFFIERIGHYRNSFLPTIHGRLLPAETGLQIRIVMVLNPLMMIIGVGLCLCALPFLVAIIYRFVITGHFEAALKIPAQVMAFLYLMFTGGFACEAIIARRLLKGIFGYPE